MDAASILMKNDASEKVVVAGLFHDVVEDARVSNTFACNDASWT
jgi:(p)ppGpp synthase/HD superfamily hydrolase